VAFTAVLLYRKALSAAELDLRTLYLRALRPVLIASVPAACTMLVALHLVGLDLLRMVLGIAAGLVMFGTVFLWSVRGASGVLHPRDALIQLGKAE
jgi:hypothetical protein